VGNTVASPPDKEPAEEAAEPVEEPAEDAAERATEEEPAEEEAEEPAEKAEMPAEEAKEEPAEKDEGPAKWPPDSDDADGCNSAYRVSVEDGLRDTEVEVLRREGMPGASVKRDTAGVFVRICASREVQERALAAVLQLRAQVLLENSLPEDTPCMPWSLQKVVTQKVQQQWWNELPKERQDELVRRCRNAGDVARTKASYCRNCTRQHFGGNEWFYCIVALGAGPPAEIIVAMNKRGLAGESPHPKAEPKQCGWTGVRHTVTEAKKLREEAKRQERKYLQMTAASNRGERVDWQEYNRLVRAAEACSTRRSERAKTSRRREVGRGGRGAPQHPAWAHRGTFDRHAPRVAAVLRSRRRSLLARFIGARFAGPLGESAPCIRRDRPPVPGP
jgi:hypothetical protein